MALQEISYAHDGVALRGFLGLPERRDTKAPGVLVLHAADGITSGVKQRVEMLAQEGFVAFGADLYGGEHPLRGKAPGEAMTSLARDNQAFRARVRAAYDLLAARPEVDGRLAAIGYCFGGAAALELARSGADVRGVVSYHGLLTTPAPARKGAIPARILVCTGAKDPYVPREDVTAFQDEMIAADADWQVIIYGQAEHAFATIGPMPDVDMPGISYHPSSDRQSWAATLTFFREIFG